jgi:hypothetical protein
MLALPRGRVNSTVRQLSLCASHTRYGKTNDFEIAFRIRPWPAGLYFQCHTAARFGRRCPAIIPPENGWRCFFYKQACFHNCAVRLLGGNRNGVGFHCPRFTTTAFDLKRRRTNRWTRAAAACFSTCSARRRMLWWASPRQLNRWAATFV